ncbi:STAS domain-containing protein [Roseiflexus castenholzii]|jgi:anti-anti-sigma regulatory factor|uniref:Anti-sigma-factor antagonist n=1 Tax=Roseiflexus castenholzii (strain DSM 13941 / HLO8) TaxID=383372 RepID=A7NF94_ROSCS|nr:STAS domain-containing protein [Roseiflexus castenholzii]ABU58760.1 anti-sigma-factor antagonist [Roseiflexus castenholzii DSM 13941]
MGWTQRRINTFLFVLILIGSLAALADVLMRDALLMTRVGYAVAAASTGILLIAYRRGWEYARHLMALGIALVIAAFINEPYISQQMDLLHAVPMVIALVLTGPRWLLINAALLLVILLVRGEWSGVYTKPVNLAAYAVLAGGMALSRLAVDNAQRLEAARRIAEEERERAANALTLAQQRANELERRNAEQEQLLRLISDLETPAITIADGVLLAPVVGRLDARRAQALNKRLLETAARQRARLVILDIAGVSHVDESVANSLIQTAQALQLIGCRVAVSGISPAVAALLASLSITLPDLITCRSPQDALTLHL